VSRFAAITAALTEDLPCGPNPDGDPELENFLASGEGQLPASFFSFSKSSLDVPSLLQQITELLQKFRDLRLVVLAGKFSILAGNVEDFCDAIVALSELLQERWEHVHPLGMDGDFSFRSAYLASLDDLPTVVLPLQYAPLVTDRRAGAISYRSHLIATGAVQRRPDEAAIDRAAIREALIKSEIETLKATYDAVVHLDTALKQIRARFIDQVGFEQAPSFEKLGPLASDIAAWLKDVLTERDPSLVLGEAAVPASDGPAAEEGAPAQGGLPTPRSTPDAIEALKAIERYYAGQEPSSPAVLLVRQAQQLIGKSFVEAMQFLAPTLMDKATIRIGGDAPFALTMAQLKTLAGQSSGAAPGSTGNGEAKPQEYAVLTRADAAALMEIIERYYRKREPSSPIPLLLERARLFVDRDFSAVLKDILSKPPAG